MRARSSDRLAPLAPRAPLTALDAPRRAASNASRDRSREPPYASGPDPSGPDPTPASARAPWRTLPCRRNNHNQVLARARSDTGSETQKRRAEFSSFAASAGVTNSHRSGAAASAAASCAPVLPLLCLTARSLASSSRIQRSPRLCSSPVTASSHRFQAPPGGAAAPSAALVGRPDPPVALEPVSELPAAGPSSRPSSLLSLAALGSAGEPSRAGAAGASHAAPPCPATAVPARESDGKPRPLVPALPIATAPLSSSSSSSSSAASSCASSSSSSPPHSAELLPRRGRCSTSSLPTPRPFAPLPTSSWSASASRPAPPAGPLAGEGGSTTTLSKRVPSVGRVDSPVTTRSAATPVPAAALALPPARPAETPATTSGHRQLQSWPHSVVAAMRPQPAENVRKRVAA
mmetsp:Transcript_14590/g.54959  ORF Transcript_14590/g.54959 Transcript_14590/m.54959 type:complete len:405 (+) Transcript_14590:2277-3491(+)